MRKKAVFDELERLADAVGGEDAFVEVWRNRVLSEAASTEETAAVNAVGALLTCLGLRKRRVRIELPLVPFLALWISALMALMAR